MGTREAKLTGPHTSTPAPRTLCTQAERIQVCGLPCTCSQVIDTQEGEMMATVGQAGARALEIGGSEPSCSPP